MVLKHLVSPSDEDKISTKSTDSIEKKHENRNNNYVSTLKSSTTSNLGFSWHFVGIRDHKPTTSSKMYTWNITVSRGI